MTTHSSSGVTQSTIGGEARPQRPVSSAENRTAAGLVRLYTAKEAADSLRVSEYWVKERARRREIPFTLVGGAYRFTEAHLDEIVEIFEQRPESTRGQTSATPRRRAQPRSQPADAVTPLRARQPRRHPKAG